MSSARRRSISPSSSSSYSSASDDDNDEGRREGVSESSGSRGGRRLPGRGGPANTSHSRDDGPKEHVDVVDDDDDNDDGASYEEHEPGSESYSEYDEEEEGEGNHHRQRHDHHHHRGDEDEYYDDDVDDGDEPNDRHEFVDGGGDGDDGHYYQYEDDDGGDGDRYNRRSQYAREDSMDVDDILLSNELFPITEMSLSSNATAAGAGGVGGGGSSGGVGMGGVGGGGSSSGGSAGAIPAGSLASNMTSASTLNSSVVGGPPHSPSAANLFRRTGSSRRSLGTAYAGGGGPDQPDPNDSYYADEDYGEGDNHPHGDRRGGLRHGEVVDDDDEGDTTLHGTVTEDDDGDDGDGDDDDDEESHAEQDPPSVSQYSERTYASTAASAASTAPSSPLQHPSERSDDRGYEEEAERLESSRSPPLRTASARSTSQRSRQSHSRRSRASTATATSTSAASTSHTTSSSASSRSRSSSSSGGSRSRSRSRSTSQRSNSYDSGSSPSRRSGSRSMENEEEVDYGDEHDRGHDGSDDDEGNDHSQHSGSYSRSHTHSRNSQGSYSEGSFSREGESRGGGGSRHSGNDESYRSESYRSRHGDSVDADSPRSSADNDDSYRSRSRSSRSRSSRSSRHDSYGSNRGPDDSLRSRDSRHTSSSRGSSSRRSSDQFCEDGEEYPDGTERSNMSHRSSSSHRSAGSRGSREQGDGSASRRSRGSVTSSHRPSDRSDSNRGSMSFDDEGSYEDDYDGQYGQPPEESEHDAAIISKKRNRDHNQHPHPAQQQVEQGYLSGESQGTPKRTNVAESTPSDESEGDEDVSPNGHGITDEAIMEALQESGLAGIEGVVVEVSDDGVVRISSSSHHEDDDEVGSDDYDEHDEVRSPSDLDENAEVEGRSVPLETVEHDSMPHVDRDDSPSRGVDEMFAAPPPSSPERSRGGNASAPGSPIATTAMSGSVMSEAGWTSVTSDTNLSNDEGGNSSSDEDDMGPKLPRDPYDARGSSNHESGSESNTRDEGSFLVESFGVPEHDEDVASQSHRQQSDHSQSSAGESGHDSASYSRRFDSQSGSGYSGSQRLSHASGTGPHSLDGSRSDRSHSYGADDDKSHSGTPSYTDSAGSASRQSGAFDSPSNASRSETIDSPSKGGLAIDPDPGAETHDSAHASAALSESQQSFSELDDPTRLNKARARLLAAYASSGYEDSSSPEQRSAKSFERTSSEATRGTRATSDPAYDENIDALVIAVAAGAAAAAEAAPEEDEGFVDKVDVWSPADEDKQAEFETSQREPSTSQNDPSYRSQTSRQSYFETENNDPLEEPSNSYRDGYDMDIEEPIHHGDTYYEEKIPRQAYGQPGPYQETLAYAGSYPAVGSEHAHGDSYYMYGDKYPEKLESSPSELIPTLSLDTGDDDDDDDEDEDTGTGVAQDPESPGKEKIVLAAKSDEVEAPASGFSKRDVRRTGIAILVTALLMLSIFLPVLLSRQSGNGPAPVAPTTTPKTFAPTSSPSLSPKTQYVISGGPFEGTIGSGFGASVGIGSEFALIGVPLISSASSFLYSNLAWGLGTNLTGQSDSQFGSSVAVAGNGLLIGSPEALDASLSSRTGAAYFFEWDQLETKWSILGSALPGYSVTLNADDLFGAAVATSLNTRVAVGSPGSGGKIYVFQYTQTSSSSYDWLQMRNSPFVGVSASGKFGTSVDISGDGMRVVGGAPNDAAGNVLVYQLSPDTSSWELEFQADGATDGEGFGSSVCFLSTTGDYLAAGGPGGNSGGGVVRVYTSLSGLYQQLGHDIIGDQGQALGAPGGLAGNQSTAGLFVLAGTVVGTVRRFDFVSSTDSWTEKFTAVTTGAASRVTGLSTSGTDTFIVGQADIAKSSIYSVDAIPNESPSAAPVPSRAPFVSPSSPSSNPVTAAPAVRPSSLSPTLGTPGFVLVGGPFVGTSGSTLGKSVSVSGSIMAAGDTSGAGTVQTYANNAETWQELSVIQGSETGSLFGFSVDVTVTNASLAVGAPSTLKNGTSTAVGSAFFYSFDVASGSWLQVGSQIRGEEDIFAANEAFGASVAASETGQIVVVGAPFSSELNIVRGGRVYAFEFNEGLGEWTPRQATSLTGDQAETNLGTSIDLSADGSVLVAGGPGHSSDTGYVIVYAWDGYRYTIVATLEGESAGERFGTSVRILSDDTDATYVAAGAPAYNSGQGVIRVFKRQSDGTYSLVATPIIGSAGDGLGSRGSLTSGGVDPTSSVLAVIAATASGMLRRYVFNPQTASWDDGTNLSTGMSSSPAVASSPDGKNVVVGGNNQAAIYSIM